MNRYRASAITGLTALIFHLAAASSYATFVKRMKVSELAEQAELVFVGKVERTQVHLSRDGKFPFTFVTFAVERRLKGTTDGPSFTLRLHGGATDTEVVEVEGMPAFQVGEKVLLFVEGNGQLGCPVLGWGQGKLSFVRDARTGQEVLKDERGSSLVGLSGGEWLRTAPEREGPAGLQYVGQDGGAVEYIESEPPPIEAKVTPRLAVSTAQTMAELERLIAERSSTTGFRQGKRMPSADPSGVPESFAGQAAAPPR